MADAVVGAGVKFNEAIATLKAKVALPTRSWDQYIGQIHGRGFTVAGATKLALLNDLQASLIRALEDGTTITDFRKAFDKAVQEHGWEYKGKRGWRTEIIFRTNMRTSRMAGKWAQIERTKGLRPYLTYTPIDDSRLRKQHRAWMKITLPVDHPWWNTHYPPNGWGCRCDVIQSSERDLIRRGLSVTDAPDIAETRRINTKTGEDFGDVPDGIDAGWNYNVGKANLGADKALAKALADMQPKTRDAVLGNISSGYAKAITPSWQSWLSVAGKTESAEGYAHAIGLIDGKLLNAIPDTAEPPSAGLLIADFNSVKLLTPKNRKKHQLSKNELDDLPLLIQNAEHVFFDKRYSTLIYALTDAGDIGVYETKTGKFYLDGRVPVETLESTLTRIR